MKTVESSAEFQPKQWAEQEARKTIESRTQPELVPNQASKSTIVRGAHMVVVNLLDHLLYPFHLVWSALSIFEGGIRKDKVDH